jgi:flagellar biosynthesis component FlhA
LGKEIAERRRSENKKYFQFNSGLHSYQWFDIENEGVKSMETGLAILMVLGIFVGIPALIGIAIGSMYLMSNRRVRRAERAKALEEAEVIAREAPKETTRVA